MKKEVFLAVFVGFILGLIITFGIWTANKSLRPQTPVATPTPQVSPTPLPTVSDTSNITLSISEPLDESILSQNSVTLIGKTLPDLPVVVTWETGQEIVTADDKGEFETDIRLEGGYNRITVMVYDTRGNSASKDLVVTYTTSKI